MNMRLMILAALLASICFGQTYMDDQSSIWSDGWADSSNVYGEGHTLGSLSFHQYGLDIEVVSPLGRVSTNLTGYLSGSVSVVAVLPWSLNDFGDYRIRTTHRGMCWLTALAFVLGQTLKNQRPPGTPCSSNETITCNEFNNEATIGELDYWNCKRSTNCCTAPNGQQSNGWCRTERCKKCSGQANDPVVSSCHGTRDVCEDRRVTAFCTGICKPRD